jgi:outer membrane receptor protein involved in Fe transport
MAQQLSAAPARFRPRHRRSLRLCACLALLAGGLNVAVSASDPGPLSLQDMLEADHPDVSSVPTSGTWQGADLRLLNVVWAGHTAVVGVGVQPVLDGIEPIALALAPGYQVGIYAQDDWQLSPTLAATLGLRIEHDTANMTHVRPRASLRWHAAPDTSVGLLYGRARQVPLAGERGYDDSSALSAHPLRSYEQLEAVEVEAEQRVGRDLKLRAAAYAWTVRNTPAPGTEAINAMPQLQPGEAVEARGLALSADHVWVGGARVRGSASLQEAVCANGTPLLGSTQWLGKVLLSAPLPWAGLRLGVEWLYDGDRIGTDGSALGAYAQSNLTLASAELGQGLEWTMSVLNLFDSRDPQLAATASGPSSPEQDRRSVQVRLAYSF